MLALVAANREAGCLNQLVSVNFTDNIMAYTIPSIDNTNTASWTPQDVAAYNMQDVWLVKKEIETRKREEKWKKLGGSSPWQQGKGPVRRAITVHDSPILRQFAFPEAITALPTIDVHSVLESYEDTRPFWHDFQTPQFAFLPSFQDFLRGNLEPNRANLQRQIVIYEEQAIRTYLVSRTRKVYVCGANEGVIDAPVAPMNSALNAANSKTTAWWLTQLNKCKSHLSFEELSTLLTEASESVGTIPFEGSGLQRMKSQGLDERYVLMTEPMTWNKYTTDPWLTQNRPLNMNIVTDGLKGDLFGQVRVMFESTPVRFKVNDAAGPVAFTLPAPETRVIDANNPSANNQTVITPDYAMSEFCVSWFIGGNSFETVDTGAPPSEFAKGMPGDLSAMDWSGRVALNKNFLIQVGVDGDGPIMDTNSKGRWLRYEATLSGGVSMLNDKNLIMVIHRRVRPSFVGV